MNTKLGLALGLALLFSLASGLVTSLEARSAGSQGDAPATELHLDHLYQHWVHSREEDRSDAGETYRPKSSKQFPPSRFRMQYIFHKDGTCEWLFLSPSDGHEFRPGRWKLEKRDGHILTIDKGGDIERYRVLELTHDVLRLASVAPSNQ